MITKHVCIGFHLGLRGSSVMKQMKWQALYAYANNEEMADFSGEW